MRIICLSIMGLLFLPSSLFCQSMAWDGTWTSVKRKEDGTVTCTLQKKGGKWTASFDGEKKGSKFSFKVPFVLTKKGKQYGFEGETKVGGDRYEMTGTFSKEKFSADYQSKSGNTGAIRLKRGK